MSSNRGHRAGQCAPEVLRTRIRARGDLQERRTRPNYSHIQHLTPSPRPGSSLIRPRCARLLAKPEYSSPPNEVCCWQGAPCQLRCCWPGSRGRAAGRPAWTPWQSAIGKLLLAGAPCQLRCCWPGRRSRAPSGRCCWPGRC